MAWRWWRLAPFACFSGLGVASAIASIRCCPVSLTRVRRYVLLRLDSVLSAGGATYDYPIITVEHVLPQNPATNSEWRQWFTDEERESSHRARPRQRLGRVFRRAGQ